MNRIHASIPHMRGIRLSLNERILHASPLLIKDSQMPFPYILKNHTCPSLTHKKIQTCLSLIKDSNTYKRITHGTPSLVATLPHVLLTTSTTHARAKSRVDASFMRHAQGQHGMITSLLRLPYELTATLFTSTSSAKKKRREHAI